MICLATESADDEDGGDQVTVKFARTESDRAKATREKSFGYLQKKNAEEQWISTKYYKDSSEESFVILIIIIYSFKF